MKVRRPVASSPFLFCHPRERMELNLRKPVPRKTFPATRLKLPLPQYLIPGDKGRLGRDHVQDLAQQCNQRVFRHQIGRHN